MESYKTYNDSHVNWIGKIPSHWDIHPLGVHSTMIVPMRDKPTRFDGVIPWIRIEDFDGQFISESKSEQNVSEDLIDEMNLKIYPIGTVLCSCSCNLGVCAIVNKPLCSNQTFIGCVPNASELDSTFLYYLMGSMDRRLNYLSSGTIQTYLSRHDFEHLSIQVPPYQEQIAIAKYLNSKIADIDALVADCEREVGLLREYRKAVISEAVTKGLDPDAPMKDSGVEWIGEIPETWSMAKVKSCCDILPGYAFKSELFMQESDSVKLLRGINLGVNAIRWDEVVSYPLDEIEELGTYRLLAGDVVIGLDRPWIKEGLRIAIIQDEVFEQYLVQRVARLRGSSEIDVHFVKYALESGLLEYELNSLTTGVSVPHISTEQIGSTRIALPDIANQHEIVALLEIKTAEIDALIDAKRTMADKLREYRRSLISEAVIGKFKVPGV